MNPAAKLPNRSDPEKVARPSLVLFIVPAYPPSNEAGATRPTHFAKYLQRFGYNVKVVTWYLQDPPRSEALYVPNRWQKPDRGSIGGLTEMALRKFLFPCDDSMLWSADAFRAAERLIRSHPDAVVFSTFPPLNVHLAALLLKRRYGIRWIADFRDPLVGSPGRRPQDFTQRLQPVADRLIQAAVFRNADVLIANTDAVLERWRKQYPQWSAKMFQIWNGFDAEETVTALPFPQRQQKVMAHAGTIYTGRHPAPLLETMDRLITNGRLDPKSLLVRLVGNVSWSTAPRRELFQRLEELGCLSVNDRRAPAEEARTVVREADYLLLLDVLIAGAGQQLPSKIFEYIQIGRPILALTTRNSPSDRVLARSGIPYACIYQDTGPEEAAHALLNVLSSPSAEPYTPSGWFTRTFDAELRTRTLSHLIDGTSPVNE